MQKTRKLISLLLAVMMVLSMCTVGMMSVSALPEDAVINDVEGSDASGIDGELYGLMGDADGDDKINVKDATQIQKFAAKLITLDEKCEALADVNLDGKVNVKDATAIQKWVAKFDVEEPINCLVYIPTVETEPTTAVVEPTSTPDEPATTAPQEDTKPSVPVIVIPTTATEPTEAPSTAAPTTEAKPTEPKATEPTTTEAKVTDAPADDVTIYFQNNWMWSNVSAHMWTANGDLTTWPGTAMTFVENDGNYDIYSVVVPEDVIGIVITGNKDTAPDELDQTPDILNWHNGQCFYMVWDSSLNEGAGGNAVDSFEYVVPTEPTTVATQPATSATQDETDATEPTTEADDGMITIYFVKPANWEGAYLYSYYGDGTNMDTLWSDEYPGNPMEFVETDENGNDIYMGEVPADINTIKFADGSTTNRRTDIIVTFYDGICFKLGASIGTDKWAVEEYDYSTEDPTDATEPTQGTTAADVDMITIYFVKPANWEGAYLYAYYGDGTNMDTLWSDEYPGNPMEFVETDENDNDIYMGEVPADINTIKFADGSTTNRRTDIIVTFYDGICFKLGASIGTDKWAVEEYDYSTEDPTDATEPTTKSEEPTTKAEEPTTEATTAETTVVTDPAESSAATDPTDAPADTITVYFTNNKNWDVVNIHCWNSNGAITTWPGVAMTYYRTNGSGQDIYMYNVPVEAESIGFNGFPTTDSSDKSKQTVTITGADLVDGRGYYPDATSNDGRWTVGFWNESGVEDTTATEPTTPGESASYTVYFINGGNWDTVAAYVWDVDPLVAWPGTVMTKTGEKVHGFDVYSITFDQEFPNIIFNNNNNGAQTDNLTMETGKYYDIKSKAWYDKLSDVPAPSKTAANVFLPGSFNSWSTSNTEFQFNAEGDTICYVELDLAANSTYTFKVITYNSNNEMEWRGLKDVGTITSSVTDVTCSRSAGDATIQTTSAGKYIFAYDTVNYKLSITFPG